MKRETRVLEEGTEEFYFAPSPSRSSRPSRPLRARVKKRGKKAYFACLTEGVNLSETRGYFVHIYLMT